MSFVVASIFATLFILLALSCNAFAATTGSATFSVDIDSAVLELTVPSNPAIIDLNPTMTGAAFGSADLTIHVATNNQTGYALTMTPQSTNLTRTTLLPGEQEYRTIGTLAQTTPASTGYTEDTFTSNTWGYRILNNTNYYGIDENNPTISHPAWTTDAPTNGTNHNLTVAAKVDADTVSGSYETTLVFTATTNAVVAKDTVSFNGNGADNADAMANDGFTLVYGQSTTLPANVYTKSGYRFIGWSTVQSGSGGMVYGDQAPYNAISSDYSHIITLYAQWVPSSMPNPSGSSSSVSGTTIARAYEIAYTAMHKGMYEEQHEGQGDYALVNSWPPDNEPYKNYDVRFAMQDMTPEICASVTVIDDAYRALDTRDNSLYFITKLQDGKCWMTENLDLDLSSSKALTNQDTDLNDKTTWTPTTTIPSTNIDPQYGGISGFSGSQTSPVSVDAGEWWSDLVWTDECTSSGFLKCSHFNQTAPSTLDDAKHHGYVGNYYNWSAAIAETSTTADKFNTDGYNAPNSICPKGWRLPIMVGTISGTTINATQEFAYMNKFYDTKNNTDQGVFGAPVYLIRFGKAYYELSYANKGYYWSATARSGIAAHYASTTSGYGPSGDTEYSDKSNAQPVRCIAR